MLNRIRLPFYLSKPQYPAEEELYLKGNGRRVVLKSIVSKVMDGKTDYMPSLIHERLSIALRHDEVNIESDKYTGSVKLSGAYDIEWIDFLGDYPVAQATFKAFEEAFVARSNRCDICEVSNFLTLEDDAITELLEEGQSYEYNVATNDSICCSDPVFSIFTYDTDYIDTISISSVGVVSFTLKSPLASAPDKDLFTYKVTCGELEELADVTGTVEGSLSALCESPSALILSITDPSSLPEEIHAEWTEPGGGAPADGYEWYLLIQGSDTVISSGTTTDTFVDINGLDCETVYQFFVRAVCDLATDYFSAYIGDEITTPDCQEVKNMFLVNETGGAVQVDVDGVNWNFAAAVNGNVEIYNSAVFTNESGLTLKFRFLQAMPSTLITEQILANGGTYNFPADVSTYNYVRVSIP
jgi:hypothetical protein